ncbi:MAG TPA: imelysin family protein [Verrucomicrobiae bacterium]|nr:imelysin family protein [Verrucomicrobiae bacterium]
MKTSAPFRLFLLLAVVAGLAAIGSLSAPPVRESKRSFTKAGMLEDLVRQVIVPAYSNFTAATDRLAGAGEGFSNQPNAQSLAEVQQAWREAMLSWRSAQVLRSGPLLEVLGRIHFWPIRRQSVEKVLRDSRPINEGYIAELGAPAVGLCAMESLLFDLKGGNETVLSNFQGREAERRRSYLRALAADLSRQAKGVSAAWTASGGYAGKFIADGQESVNLMVNDLLQAVEIATEERLKYALDLQESKLLKPEYIQGAAAGISHRSIVEVIRGAHRFYAGVVGFGLVAQLEQIGSPTAQRVERQFQTALKALEAIGAPLEKTLPLDRAVVLRAYEECKTLEILLKTEMASALGVTLTFNSTDGD